MRVFTFIIFFARVQHMTWHTHSIQEFSRAVKELFQNILDRADHEQALIITLTGDLGAGKTTMTQIIAQFLGVSETVQSPTFVIKKNYSIDYMHYKTLVHIDAYRLEGEKNINVFRFEEDMHDPEKIVIIEWSEFIADILPEKRFSVSIESISENERIISLQ